MRRCAPRTEKTKQKKEPPIEKVSTITTALKIVPLSYLSIPRDKTCIFPLLGNLHTYCGTIVRADVCSPLRVIWQGFCVFKIHVYVMVCQSYWYVWVTVTSNFLAGFPIYLRYRYLLTISICTYQGMLILESYNFWFEFIA